MTVPRPGPRRRAFALGVMLLLAPGALSAQNGASAKKKDPGDRPAPMAQLVKLAWLAGSWRMEKAGRVVEEIWMAPSGGVMLGLSRTVVKGRVTEYEFMQIREGPGGELFFVAAPSGQKEAAFQLLSLADNSVIFENLQHDFPQRILYTRGADGSVLAAIEGPVGADDKRKRIEFPYQRVEP
jgi:hypothetical protein